MSGARVSLYGHNCATWLFVISLDGVIRNLASNLVTNPVQYDKNPSKSFLRKTFMQVSKQCWLSITFIMSHPQEHPVCASERTKSHQRKTHKTHRPTARLSWTLHHLCSAAPCRAPPILAKIILIFLYTTITHNSFCLNFIVIFFLFASVLFYKQIHDYTHF